MQLRQRRRLRNVRNIDMPATASHALAGSEIDEIVRREYSRAGDNIWRATFDATLGQYELVRIGSRVRAHVCQLDA
ncbi:hypothetical protein PTKU64_18710 [Paraburkholderia terrae]|uniref:Uncharacterized protein n=1 Tax=Paraburkholderia terrae TaxID=311230 RepID=A0ABM7TGW4_9BURK|nr:hypothetical protein PTKU64_18710 [Paraburkholderia terrae]